MAPTERCILSFLKESPTKRYAIKLLVEERGGVNNYTLQEAMQDGKVPQEGDRLFGIRHFFEDVGINLLECSINQVEE